MVRQQKGEVLIVSFGALVQEALEAAELLGRLNIRTDVYNLRFIQPLDLDYLVSLFYRYRMDFPGNSSHKDRGGSFSRFTGSNAVQLP